MAHPHNFAQIALFTAATTLNEKIIQLNSGQSRLDLHYTEGPHIFLLLEGNNLFELFWSSQYGCNLYYKGRRIEYHNINKCIEGARTPRQYISDNWSQMGLCFQATAQGYAQISSEPTHHLPPPIDEEDSDWEEDSDFYNY